MHIGELRYFFLPLAVAVVVAGCGIHGQRGVVRQGNPRVLFQTDLGDITVEVYEKQAPVTAANFLRYVDEHRFKGASFYRTVRPDNQPNNAIKIEVIQGGLKDDEGHRGLPPIEHESTARTGVLHRNGTVSMARTEPGTASSEFFISIGDQPELDFGGKRNSDGQGFAAFGQVVSGMDVVRKIQAQPADGQWLTPDIPITGVKLLSS
jgi:peptidyl-prolyl cis-trans isomerase A (cyclophilin A)